MLRFQAVPSAPLAFSTAVPGSALGAVAAGVASTTPQRLRDFNALATSSPRGPAIVGRSAVLGAQIGLRAAWQLWIWFAANASGAILGVGGSAAMMIAPLVSLSVLAAMMVPAFWALLCFGGAGILSGILGGAVLASGSPAYLALSIAQARLRAAVVIGAMTSPGIVAVAASYGLAPNVLEFFPEDLRRSGEHIDWKTKRSRFREV